MRWKKEERVSRSTKKRRGGEDEMEIEDESRCCTIENTNEIHFDQQCH